MFLRLPLGLREFRQIYCILSGSLARLLLLFLHGHNHQLVKKIVARYLLKEFGKRGKNTHESAAAAYKLAGLNDFTSLDMQIGNMCTSAMAL